MTKKEPEIVHTMTAYYDGPRCGIVDYQGKPHLYESQFKEAVDGSDLFLLQPVDDETLRLAMEDWAIWCRWERAFYNGETTNDTRPALPEDRGRHDELETILSERLKMRPGATLRVRGYFSIRAHEMIVFWTPNESAV